jgi:7-carboxy-7-deazaguanine synthase (Cx14CxxC type)
MNRITSPALSPLIASEHSPPVARGQMPPCSAPEIPKKALHHWKFVPAGITLNPMSPRSYAIKEIYFSLQGEGARTGRPAIFCRFAGCNLWNGREKDRATSLCSFCDTDFLGTDGPGGGHYSSEDALTLAMQRIWPEDQPPPYVVFTGGEPLLQLDPPLIAACHRLGFEVALETNGTLPVPAGVDWICVSPKPNSPWVQRSGQELKIVYPTAVSPDGLEALDFDYFFVQPLDGPELQLNTERAIEYCRTHPPWRLSLQTHKLMGIP